MRLFRWAHFSDAPLPVGAPEEAHFSRAQAHFSYTLGHLMAFSSLATSLGDNFVSDGYLATAKLERDGTQLRASTKVINIINPFSAIRYAGVQIQTKLPHRIETVAESYPLVCDPPHSNC